MKTNNVLTIYICLLFCFASCVPNMTLQKRKQGEALRILGEAYMMQGEYTAALREFFKAEKIYPNDPYLQNDLGLVFMSKNRLDMAVARFKKAIIIKSDYTSAKNNLGAAYLAKKDWDSAIFTFKELAENLLYATPHYPLSNLGWAYYNKKQYKLAEEYYLKSLGMKPDFTIALRGIGKTYVAVGNISQAIDFFEKAIKTSPQFADLYFDIANAYTLIFDYEKAFSAYRKVIELRPETPLANAAQQEIERIKQITSQ